MDTPTIDTSNMASQVIPTASSSNQGSGGSGDATPTSAPITGTQAAWSKLQLPTPVGTASSVVKPMLTTAAASSMPVNDGWDAPRRILLTALAVLLALMLIRARYWRCTYLPWRKFVFLNVLPILPREPIVPIFRLA
jgi:hypothetical protein